MEMNESPMKEIENYSDESTITSDSSGDSGGSFSPPVKRLRKVLTISCTNATDDDDDDDDSDNKTSSTRSSISEELGGPHLLQPSDPLQETAVCQDTWISLIRQTYPRPQPNIETFEVDPKWLACYARQALGYFEETTGEVYRYEGPRSMCLCSLPDSEYKVTHINFFARPKGKLSESLFFAALEHGPVRKVVECCTVPLFKAGDGVVPFIKHPPHVECSECSKFGEAVLCFEVEEEELCCIPWSSVSSLKSDCMEN